MNSLITAPIAAVNFATNGNNCKPINEAPTPTTIGIATTAVEPNLSLIHINANTAIAAVNIVLIKSPVPAPTYFPSSGLNFTTPDATKLAPAVTIIGIGLKPNCKAINAPIINGVANWKITAICVI